MKKIILPIILFVFSLGYSQTLLQGFESSGSIGGAFGGFPVPVIETGTGSNTSQVLKIVTNPTQEPWQGINLFLSPSTDLTVNKTLTMDVLSSTPITFLVKVTRTGSTSAAPVTHNGDGTWQTLSFTFNTALDGQSANPTGTYTGFVIHPYWEVGRTQFFTPTVVPKPPRTFYVDNIREPAPVGPPVNDVTGDVYINDGTFTAGDFTTAAGQDIATNDGSAAEPFATLDYALARSTQVPGDVIYIDAGTYSWASTHALTDSGTIANPITIQGKGNNETNITTTAASTTSAGLHFTTGEHWVVKDLNWTATAARAVWVAAADGITLDNCNINMTSASTSLQSIIIGTAGGELTIKNSTLTRSNTTFHMIEVVEGTTLIMQDNTVRFPILVFSSTASSIQIRTNASSLFIIERNKFINGGYGIGNVNGTSGPINASSIIKNNFFNSFWGIVTTIVQGLTVHNNSFYTNFESIYGINVGSLTNWDIRNNILYTYGSSTSCILSGSATSHPAVMDYNHYYSPNTGAGRTTLGGPILSFTSWQYAAGGPWETNGQGGNAASFNPLYRDAANGDLHLLPGSPAIGAGVDVGITDDIDGDARPLSGTFDMGADEFIPTVSSDASLSDLQVNDVSISGFSPVTTDYTVVVSCSVSSIPQITSATPTSPLASVVITQAPDVFEDATVVVTAEDGITTETYTVTIGVDSSDIIQDFEPPATYTGLTGDNGTLATIQTSPAGVGGNSLRLVSTSGGATFQAGFFNQVSDFVVLTAENNTVQVDVYSTQAFNLRLKLESGATPIERTVQYTTPNTWQTLTFNFGAVTATYSRIVFFLNSNATNTGFLPSQNFTAFVDNISLSSVQTERLTYTYDNGWLPSDPIGITGCFDTFEIASGNVNISADTEIESVTIQPGASMTIDTGVTLTATTVNLNSTSNAFSSLILEGNLTGTVNYNRFTSSVGPVGTNDLISSPVSSQTFGDFVAANPNLAESGTTRAFAPYNTVTGAYENYDIVANAATEIASGTGFRAATIDGSTLTFTGAVSSLDLNITILDAGNAWNLIGNPYPSYLDFDTFFTVNKTQFDAGGAFQAIYGYDGDSSNGWTVWNQATIDGAAEPELIAPGQAFFVKAKASGGLVDFTTTMRRFGSDDDFIPGRSANSANVALSELILTSAANTTHTSIYFIEDKTKGIDSGFDAGSYQGAASAFSIFTNLVEQNEGLDMAIQTLGYNDFNDVVIPLGIKATAEEGQLVIALGDNFTLPSNINVYLDDTQENTMTLLNNSDYTFLPANDLVGTGRFYLRYSSQVLSLVDKEELNDLIIFANESKDIIIKGMLTEATVTNLYDIQGRLVISQKLEQSSLTHTINGATLSSGVYVIQVSNNKGRKTQKLIIK